MSYKNTVLPIIRKTRAISLPSWGFCEIIDIKNAHPASIVTEIDGAVEGFLKKELSVIYPDIVFVGEEMGGNREAEKFWLVDPIDATGHYMRGLPFTTTMLALIDNGEVVFSVIYDFINDVVYWAEKGEGAYKNDERIHVSNRTLIESYVSVEIQSKEGKNDALIKKIDGKMGSFSSISAGWEFAMIACGKMDGRIMVDPFGKDYDFSPGSLLVREAGGIVTNLGVDTYDYRNTNCIIANPKVHAELSKIFEEVSS